MLQYTENMFVGHYATGLALFSSQKLNRDSDTLLVFLIGAMFADFLWGGLTLLGIEGGHSMGGQQFHKPHLPWSHSILATFIWAFLWGVIGWFWAKYKKISATRIYIFLFSLNIIAHWVIGDALVAEAFFVTPFDDSAINMPHLYANIPVAFSLETILIVVLWFICLFRALPAAYYILAAMLFFHTLLFIPGFTEEPAINLDEQPLAILAYMVPSILLLLMMVYIYKYFQGKALQK